MNRMKLKKEGKKWVQDGLISEEQLERIIASYVKKDQSYLLVLFAVLLISIGILIFVFSDWAQVPHVSRITIMVVSMVLLYGFGHYFFMKETSTEAEDLDKRTHIYGISLIVLGYIFFGASLLLLLNMYNVTLESTWPFIIWSVVGFLLYVLYEHQLLFVIGIVVNVIGQLVSSLSFSSFSVILFLIFITGYFYYTFRRANLVGSYLFAVGLSIQLVVLSTAEFEQYYWFMFFILIMYAFGELIQKDSLKQAFIMMSLLSVFIFKMSESFILQDYYYLKDLEMNGLFFILIGIVWLFIFALKWLQKRRQELIDLILFIPFFFLPNAYIFVIISMFVFALYWLIIGFQRQIDDKIIVGIVSFIVSTFTVYIQFAWETLNKSLFFLIGGLLLFALSFILERQRRKSEQAKKGADQ